MTNQSESTDLMEAKRAIRREMRALRKALPDREQRSERIWAQVQHLPEVTGARAVMAFASVPGEPITGPFIAWCRERMANYKVPRRVRVVDAFPLNATGKVLKYELRTLAAAGGDA